MHLSRALPLAILAVILTGGALRAEKKEDPRTPEVLPEGTQATLRITPDHPWVGDWMKIEIQLKNTGQKSYPFVQWIGREHQDFKVSVTDETGVLLPDIYEAYGSPNSMGAERVLEPGKTLSFTYPLGCFVHLERPGKYHLRLVRILGREKTPDHTFPVAETDLVLKEPDAAHIQKEVTALCNLPDLDEDRDSKLYALHSNIFLPALLYLAQHGIPAAIRGMENIRTMEATANLVELLKQPNRKISLAAAKALANRLPRILWYVDENAPTPLWDDRFNPEFLSYAKTLLSSSRRGSVGLGADIYQAIGSPPDMVDLRKALQSEILSPTVPAPISDEPRIADELDQEDHPLQHLLKAVDSLINRGYRCEERDFSNLRSLPDKVGTSKPAKQAARRVEQYILFSQLQKHEYPAPNATWWKNEVHAALHSDVPDMLTRALQAIPSPMGDEWVPEVLRLWKRRNFEEAALGSQIAYLSKRSDFIDPLLNILKTSADDDIAFHASEVVWQMGKHLEVWQAWTDKLSRFNAYPRAADFLCQILEHGHKPYLFTRVVHDYMGQRDCLAFQKRWRDFLQLHGDELAKGKRYSDDDPMIRPLMVSPGDGKPVFRPLTNGSFMP